MAIYEVVSPYVSNAYANQLWRPPLEMYRAQNQTALDGLDALDISEDERSLLRTILQNNLAFMDECVTRGGYSYEDVENSGIGSNGLTLARHVLLHPHYRARYPETYAETVDPTGVYGGRFRLADHLPGSEQTVGWGPLDQVLHRVAPPLLLGDGLLAQQLFGHPEHQQCDDEKVHRGGEDGNGCLHGVQWNGASAAFVLFSHG